MIALYTAPSRMQFARSWQKPIAIAIILIAFGLILLSGKRHEAQDLARKVLFDVHHDIPITEPATPSASQLASPSNKAEVEAVCPDVPGGEDVLVVLKTGATEANAKLPIHFQTTFKCIPHFTIFSDMAETIQGHQVHDVLEVLPQNIFDVHRDQFRLYHALKKAQMNNIPAASVARPAGDNVGWDLDKWKFLPMVKKAHEMKPDAKWFVFIEADTFMMWSNLLRYLSFLDPNVPEYRGGPAWFDVIFAHGGSGIIMSSAAVKVTVDALARNENYYSWPAPECCGDLVLSKVLMHNGINFTSAYPLVQGEQPTTLDYTKEKWCRPVISYHHVDDEATLEMWRFEQRWLKGLVGSKELKPAGASTVSILSTGCFATNKLILAMLAINKTNIP